MTPTPAKAPAGASPPTEPPSEPELQFGCKIVGKDVEIIFQEGEKNVLLKRNVTPSGAAFMIMRLAECLAEMTDGTTAGFSGPARAKG